MPGRSADPRSAETGQHWDDIADDFVGLPDPDWQRDMGLLDQTVTNPWERDRLLLGRRDGAERTKLRSPVKG